MKKTLIRFLYAAAGITAVVISLAIFSGHTKTADELRAEAAAKRIEAMHADCSKIATRVSECFMSKTKGECKQMQDSYAWFSAEYAESPDFACTTVPDPLGFGSVALR